MKIFNFTVLCYGSEHFQSIVKGHASSLNSQILVTPFSWLFLKSSEHQFLIVMEF